LAPADGNSKEGKIQKGRLALMETLKSKNEAIKKPNKKKNDDSQSDVDDADL
jgi:hypothetical protein